MIRIEDCSNAAEIIAAAAREGGSPCAVLLSSGDSPWARWSLAAGPARMRLRCDEAGRARLIDAGCELRTWDDPLAALAWMASAHTVAGPDNPQLPPFKGGWIGMLSYDLGRFFEALPATAADDLRLPLFDFTFHDDVVAYDHIARAGCRIRLDHDFSREPLALPDTIGRSTAPLRSNFTRPQYEAAVGRALEYIGAGDVFQINLSQRLSVGLNAAPADILKRLGQTPAWFGAYLHFGDYALLSNSPELFLRVRLRPDCSRTVVTRPVKGTRPRAPGMRDVLRDSVKDQAELNMIIDLERNDLGRVCRTGSVRVLEPRTIEEHPTVYHGAATIEGILRDDVDLLSLLRATFPGGSITGAPKIRAMQIIEELERTRRGPYCGAIGYLGADGRIDLNIAIRTMILSRGQVHIPVGGGIVADSDPADEYEETLVKARAMLAAMGMCPSSAAP